MDKVRAQAQSRLEFALHSLGWHSFQDLCMSVAKHTFGQVPVIFLPGKDCGRDGAFYGKFRGPDAEPFEGSTTIQCKHTSSAQATLKPSILKEELIKAQRLAARGLADNYILLTNYGVSAEVEANIRARYLAIPGIRKALILGRDWINQELRESPKLRMMVPRVYGIGDLSQIIDERFFDQAREILSTMEDDLSKLVVTDAYRKAATALDKHNFVLLIGEPASGKSLIAASLALSALDRWKSPTLKVRNGTEFKHHWNTGEPRFFWIDDAFGPTQYSSDLVQDWNSVLPELKSAIRKGCKVLFTSRDYIWNMAKQDIKGSEFPIIFDSQVLIEVQDLKPTEKKQIIYNHLRGGRQPRQFRTAVKGFLEGIAANEAFLPEIARRLGDPQFTAHMSLTLEAIRAFVEKPLDFLKKVIQELDSPCRAALALLFVSGGVVPSPIPNSDDLTLGKLCTGCDVEVAIGFC